MENTGFIFIPGWSLPVTGLLINIILAAGWGKKRWHRRLRLGCPFVVSVLLAYSVSAAHGETLRLTLAPWLQFGSLSIDWTFRVDSLSTTMMLVVSGVGTLIHIYAIGYMHEDVRFKKDEKRYRRFFVFLNLFIAMMMILVSGDNYLMLFVGWEGVGLCSYLLIGFW
jgi:NADH-quinone oxidoreductase subunit L